MVGFSPPVVWFVPKRNGRGCDIGGGLVLYGVRVSQAEVNVSSGIDAMLRRSTAKAGLPCAILGLRWQGVGSFGLGEAMER